VDDSDEQPLGYFPRSLTFIGSAAGAATQSDSFPTSVGSIAQRRHRNVTIP
jgi:hypothetical protein